VNNECVKKGIAMHILHVVGARPNFMKVSPVYSALQARGVRQTLLHTGQHYDANMSDIFFQQLELPPPDVFLGVGSGSHAEQTAEVMKCFEKAVLEAKPDMVLVYGDINSTVAAALVSRKLGIPLGHVEAGLRSFDRALPEEVNRIVTDQLADALYTPSADADENLLREGISPDRIHRVGNVMIDTLVRLRPKALLPEGVEGLSSYGLVTMHRPSNVDNFDVLRSLMCALVDVSDRLPLVFPVHPRTRQCIEQAGVQLPDAERIRFLEPVGYLECLALQQQAQVVITDSGGLQEETTYLGVPCVTMRESTERPVTIEMGSNRLVGTDATLLLNEVTRILDGEDRPSRIPELWDGAASERIADRILGSAVDEKSGQHAAA
jgi:UDP-N-acetylglucosamine 2-epimerase (non-hydrolysing)